MEQALYPAPSQGLSQRRKDLAGAVRGVSIIQQTGICRWSAAVEDEGADCRRRRARDPVPVLHPQPHQTRDPKGREPARDHGSYLGSC